MSIDIRNLRNEADKARKENQLLASLRQQAKLAEDYNQAVIEQIQNKKLDITPIAPAERSATELEGDKIYQRQTFFNNMKSIMQASSAQRLMTDLTDDQILITNQNFKDILIELKGRTNITPDFFRRFLARYTQKLKRTGDTGIEFALRPEDIEKQTREIIRPIEELRLSQEEREQKQVEQTQTAKELRDALEREADRMDGFELKKGLKQLAIVEYVIPKLMQDDPGLDSATYEARANLYINPSTELGDQDVLLMYDLPRFSKKDIIALLKKKGQIEYLPEEQAIIETQRQREEQNRETRAKLEQARIEARQTLQDNIDLKNAELKRQAEQSYGIKFTDEEWNKNQEEFKKILAKKRLVKGVRQASMEVRERERIEQERLDAEIKRERERIESIQKQKDDYDNELRQLETRFTKMTKDYEKVSKALEGQKTKIRQKEIQLAQIVRDTDAPAERTDKGRATQRSLENYKTKLNYYEKVIFDMEQEYVTNLGPRIEQVLEQKKLLEQSHPDIFGLAFFPPSGGESEGEFAPIGPDVGFEGYGIRNMSSYGHTKIIKPRGRRIVGRGISTDADERYKEFGKYLIHIPSLKKGILNLKFPSYASIPTIKQTTLSTDLLDLIVDLLESQEINKRLYTRMSKEDQDFFYTIAQKAGIDQTLGLGIRVNETQKKEMERFNLLRGQIIAGNNNPTLLKELKQYIVKFMRDGTMNRHQGNDLLFEISCLA